MLQGELERTSRVAQTQAFQAGDGHSGTQFAVEYLEKALGTYL